mgnify:CR=1 FL=1
MHHSHNRVFPLLNTPYRTRRPNSPHPLHRAVLATTINYVGLRTGAAIKSAMQLTRKSATTALQVRARVPCGSRISSE